MAKTKSEMFTLIGANLPDNTAGAITPEKLREVTTQIADSMLYAAAGVKEVEVLRSASTTTQAPSALDTPYQVIFGAASGTSSSPVMLSTAGLLTFNVAGSYAVRVKLQKGRTSGTGTAVVFSRLVINGTPFGSPAVARMDNANPIFPIESRVALSVGAGATLAVQIIRDSGGANSGGIVALTPTTLTAWGSSPAALIVVSRLEPV